MGWGLGMGHWVLLHVAMHIVSIQGHVPVGIHGGNLHGLGVAMLGGHIDEIIAGVCIVFQLELERAICEDLLVLLPMLWQILLLVVLLLLLLLGFGEVCFGERGPRFRDGRALDRGSRLGDGQRKPPQLAATSHADSPRQLRLVSRTLFAILQTLRTVRPSTIAFQPALRTRKTVVTRTAGRRPPASLARCHCRRVRAGDWLRDRHPVRYQVALWG